MSEAPAVDPFGRPADAAAAARLAALYDLDCGDAVTPRSPKLLAVGRRRERVVGERRGT